MAFVNIHGQPINVGTTTQKKESKPREDTGPQHKGWLVVGHSPTQIEEFKKTLKPNEEFNLLIFARRVKFSKVRSKPYVTNEAAQICASMATKEGWVNVQVQPVLKGVK